MFIKAAISSRGKTPAGYHDQQAARGTKDFIVSSSSLRDGAYCWSRWKKGHESPETKAQRKGSLFDVRLLTPDDFSNRFSVQPEEYESEVLKCPACGSVTESLKCAKCKVDRLKTIIKKPWTNQSTTCAAWTEKQEANGKMIVTQQEMLDCDAAMKAIRTDELVCRYLEQSDRQVHVIGEWQDEKTGLSIPCQALIDLVPFDDSEFYASIADLKTARNAHPRAWESDVQQRGYYIQSAFHLDLFNAATDQDRNTCRYILSENVFPFQQGVRQLTDDFLIAGRNEYQALLADYATCLAHDRWPGYDHGSPNDPAFCQGWRYVNSPEWLALAQAKRVPLDFTDKPRTKKQYPDLTEALAGRGMEFQHGPN